MKKWYFDHYTGNREADRPKKSWVQLADTECGQSLTIHVNGEKKMTIAGDLDQWGTWIGIGIEKDKDYLAFTVAQEWSTKSFIQAFLAGLQEFLKICDFEGNLDKQTPEYVEEPDPPVETEHA